jgi:hypothetical protein
MKNLMRFQLEYLQLISVLMSLYFNHMPHIIKLKICNLFRISSDKTTFGCLNLRTALALNPACVPSLRQAGKLICGNYILN